MRTLLLALTWELDFMLR